MTRIKSGRAAGSGPCRGPAEARGRGGIERAKGSLGRRPFDPRQCALVRDAVLSRKDERGRLQGLDSGYRGCASRLPADQPRASRPDFPALARLRSARQPRAAPSQGPRRDRRSPRHHPCGVFLRGLRGLGASTALRVRDVVMGRLPGGTLPRAALSCIARLAGEFASSTVQIDFLDGALSPHDRALLAQSGFRPSGTMFSRTVASNAPRTGTARVGSGSRERSAEIHIVSAP